MINLSTLAVVLFVYIAAWGMYWIILAIQPCASRCLNKERSKKFTKFVDWYHKSLFYRWIFVLFLFGFMEFIIAGFLGMYKPLDSYPNETLGNLMAYVSLCVPLICLPAVYIWLHEEKDGTYDQDKDVVRMFPKSHTHFAVSVKKKAGFLFYPLYMAHRTIYLLLILVFTSPTSQILSVFALTWLQRFYIANYKPMKGRKQNYYEMFNELSITLVTLLMAYYRVSADDIEKQWLYGDIIIGIILFHCACSLLLIWFWIFKHGWLLLKLLGTYLQPYVDYLFWRLQRCWNWNKPVENLDDLVSPEERKSGHSNAFLIIQRIKKENLGDANKKVRKFKIDTRDDEDGVEFKEKDKEDVELNVGKLVLNVDPMKVVGDGKLTHERNEQLKIEEDEQDESELRAMQKAIADTGLLNTL